MKRALALNPSHRHLCCGVVERDLGIYSSVLPNSGKHQTGPLHTQRLGVFDDGAVLAFEVLRSVRILFDAFTGLQVCARHQRVRHGGQFLFQACRQNGQIHYRDDAHL